MKTPILIILTTLSCSTVSVTLSGQTTSSVADEMGRWSVELEPLKASAKGRTLQWRDEWGQGNVPFYYDSILTMSALDSLHATGRR